MEDKIKIDTLKELRKKFLRRVEDLEEGYRETGHNPICNRISQLREDINVIEEEIEKISPADCDW